MTYAQNIFTTTQPNETNFVITWTPPYYVNTNDVKAEVDEVAWTVVAVSGTNVTLATGIPTGSEVRIYRETDISDNQVNFLPGSPFRAEDVNADFDQILFGLQEAITADYNIDLEIDDINVKIENLLQIVNNSIQYVQLADVAALDAAALTNPGNLKGYEVLDSTGITAANPEVFGLPPQAGDGTGEDPVNGVYWNSNVRTRVVWDSLNVRWLFLSYYSADPDNRYQQLVLTSTTQPTVADYKDGTFWFDNSTLYILHNDGVTRQWIPTHPAAPTNFVELSPSADQNIVGNYSLSVNNNVTLNGQSGLISGTDLQVTNDVQASNDVQATGTVSGNAVQATGTVSGNTVQATGTVSGNIGSFTTSVSSADLTLTGKGTSAQTLSTDANDTLATKSYVDAQAGGSPPITFNLAITGNNRVTDTLTCSVTNIAGGTSPQIYSYQWRSTGAPTGTGASTYVLQTSDSGNTITCDVIVTDSNGSNGTIKTATYSQTIIPNGSINQPSVLTPADGEGTNLTPFYPYSSNVTGSTTDTSNASQVSPGTSEIYDVLQLTNNAASKYVGLYGNNTTVLWSSNGTTWTHAPGRTGYYDGQYSATDGTEIVSAVAGSGFYSSGDDGQNWSARQYISRPFNVAYGNGKFVGVGAANLSTTSQQTFWSYNGISWNTGGTFTIPVLNNHNSCPWTLFLGGGLFVACYYYQAGSGNYLSTIARTGNGGTSWAVVHSSNPGIQYRAAAADTAGNILVATLGGNNDILYSTDYGTTFSTVTNRPGTSANFPQGNKAVSFDSTRQIWTVVFERSVWQSIDSDPNNGWIQVKTFSGTNMRGTFPRDVSFVSISYPTGNLLYSQDGISWDSLHSELTFTNSNVYDSAGNLESFTFADSFTRGSTVFTSDNSVTGTILDYDTSTNTMVVMNLTAPGTQFPTSAPIYSTTQLTPVAPDAATLEFTSDAPTGVNITTWGDATWEVSTDAAFTSPMSTTKALVTGTTQSLAPSERGNITLASNTTYHVRVKYDSTNPAITSSYSSSHEFKTRV